MYYVQAGQGRTYAEKVDAGPLVAYLHLQTFSSFGGFQVFKFWERERELILLLKRRALILLLPLLIRDHALDRREITSQSIEEKGITTIRLDLEPRLQIKSKADSRAQQTIAHNKAKMPSFALLSKKAALEIQAPLEIETFVWFK